MDTVRDWLSVLMDNYKVGNMVLLLTQLPVHVTLYLL